jgi:hypothetical protein
MSSSRASTQSIAPAVRSPPFFARLVRERRVTILHNARNEISLERRNPGNA